jgi:Flp pilus assembly pilin Flp
LIIKEKIMKYITNKIKVFFTDEQGGEVAEWAVVVAILIAISVAAYGVNLLAAIQAAVATLSTAITTGG